MSATLDGRPGSPVAAPQPRPADGLPMSPSRASRRLPGRQPVAASSARPPALPARPPAPQPAAPPAGAASDWVRAPERSNAFALRAVCAIAVACGRPATRLLLHPITAYFLLFGGAARRNALRYLGRALGRRAGWRDAYRLFHTFAATLLDRVYLLRDRLDLYELRFEGREAVDAMVAEGRGAFLVGAHFGSFEALRAVGRQVAGLRVAMVMYPDNARLIADALAAIAPDARPDIIALGRAGSMLAIRDWLDGGGLAGMLGDRALPGASARAGSVTLPFLGREAGFGDGPFRLAALLRRRVLFMAGIHEGGARYRVVFEPLADFGERVADAAERERRIRAAVAAYAARLEALAREHPHNWFNFHDFWGEDDAR